MIPENNFDTPHFLNLAITEAVESGCILLLGPGAFANYEGIGNEGLEGMEIKTLRDEILEGAEEYIKESVGRTVSFLPKQNSVYDAVAEINDCTGINVSTFNRTFFSDKFFWQYPQITNYLKLGAKVIFYLGYDQLLFQAAEYLGLSPKLFTCSINQSNQLNIKWYSHLGAKAKPVDSKILDDLQQAALDGDDSIYIINLLGGVDSRLKSGSRIIDLALALVAAFKGPSQGSLRRLVSIAQLLANPIDTFENQRPDVSLIVAGANSASPYAQPITTLISRINQIDSVLYLDESAEFYQSIYSRQYLNTLGLEQNVIVESETARWMGPLFSELDAVSQMVLDDEPNAGRRVFISYANENQILAEEVSNSCKALGLAPYLYTEDLRSGENWFERAKPMMEASEKFIAVCTDMYFKKSQDIQSAINVELCHAGNSLSSKHRQEMKKPFFLVLDFRDGHGEKTDADYAFGQIVFNKDVFIPTTSGNLKDILYANFIEPGGS